MEFVKQMKKREFIEMGLKTLAAVMAAFLAIILMEGMIYGIKLNSLKNGTSSFASSSGTTAYCIKEDDDKYFVIYRYVDPETEKITWSATKNTFYTKAECEAMEGDKVAKVEMNAPNAFVFTITPIHFVVMAVFMSAVAGFFVYKFVALSKEYKKIEDEFEKTGTISIG